MQKLYKLYKQVILESTEVEAAQDAINKHHFVNIDYDGVTRYCGVFAIGMTSAGNQAIRVYQSAPESKERWKTFILNKIDKWAPTKMKFYSPLDNKFNINGDKTLNISNGDGGNIAKFDDKHMDSQRTRHSDWQSSLDTQQTNEPLAKDRSSSENPYDEYEYNKNR